MFIGQLGYFYKERNFFFLLTIWLSQGKKHTVKLNTVFFQIYLQILSNNLYVTNEFPNNLWISNNFQVANVVFLNQYELMNCNIFVACQFIEVIVLIDSQIVT